MWHFQGRSLLNADRQNPSVKSSVIVCGISSEALCVMSNDCNPSAKSSVIVAFSSEGVCGMPTDCNPSVLTSVIVHYS